MKMNRSVQKCYSSTSFIKFILPHSRGSSHGQTRITRMGYQEDYYTRMMKDCFTLWAQLESEAKVKIYSHTGLLLFGKNDDKQLGKIQRTMKHSGNPPEILTHDDFTRKFPNVSLQPGEVAFMDRVAGVLYANQALLTVQKLFQDMGGVIRDREKVIDIQPGNLVTVKTASGAYKAKSLVITAGPWTNSVLNQIALQLPLKTLRINVCYWKEKVAGTYGLSHNFPCFIGSDVCNTGHDIYGLPSNEYPGLMKICYHSGEESDPEKRDIIGRGTPQDIKILGEFVKKYFPGLESEPAVVESCMYTCTPDNNFILDCHPVHENIIIGAGFSGHGFKLSPVVGKILCELSMGKTPSHDISPFKMNRFSIKLKSAL
ncbi:peroxisomal sarcosine oxidase isoform X2 [Protopterus annectens]|uniref:peroxisomal sarcosine oxidase isoform X2 n=1 Tax=Protopterus annectens TaxID=7888 RepID=UPI001CFB9645|nr:peroxisomal sarcosine oxidase isoform X2 [Protopterus annectens]